MTGIESHSLRTARVAHAALEAALVAMESLTVKDLFDHQLIHDLQSRCDDLHWRIEEMRAADGDRGAQERLNRACYIGMR